MDYPMRINKYLALKNHATRRGSDELVERHKVFINGRLAVVGDKVQEDDEVEVRNLGGAKKIRVYFAYNKPAGVITEDITSQARELEGTFPVGRLDKDSHGLIILTNDGRITDRLLSPGHQHEKEYIVKTKERLREGFAKRLEAGVDIEGYQTKPCKVKVLGEHSFSIILTEGKKHQIRRMVVALHNEVQDLKRTRILNITLEDLKPGAYRPIEGGELEVFLHALGM